MHLVVFVSHSMSELDKPLLYEIGAMLNNKGITPYIAEHDQQFGSSISEKIKNAIRECSLLVALLTRDGDGSAFVHEEIGFAHACQKLVIPIVEKGVALKGFNFGNDYVELDRQNPSHAFRKLDEFLMRQISPIPAKQGHMYEAAPKKNDNALAVLVVLIVLLVLAAVSSENN